MNPIEEIYNALGEDMFAFLIMFVLAVILLLIILVPRAIDEMKK